MSLAGTSTLLTRTDCLTRRLLGWGLAGPLLLQQRSLQAHCGLTAEPAGSALLLNQTPQLWPQSAMDQVLSGGVKSPGPICG